MLTNGFFARLIIVDIGKRGEGQTPGSARNLPEPIIQTARWWAEFQPGTRQGNLMDIHPEPLVVSRTPEAEQAIADLQRLTEQEYDDAHHRNDEVARVAWSRTHENAMKLALIRACSTNHENPTIDLGGIQWATAFAMHQTKRQLYLAHSYVAENPFHAECLKLVRKLRTVPNRQMEHSPLLKLMHMKAADFRELIQTLLQQNEIKIVTVPRAGSSKVIYKLV
jgi:hypothetical protein